MYQCGSNQATNNALQQQMQSVYDQASAVAVSTATACAAQLAFQTYDRTSACQYASPPREICERIPQHRREVIHVQGPPGKVRQVVKRLPVPLPDIIERIMVIKPQQDIINVIVEHPPIPPPQIIEKRIVEKQPPPIVNHHLVRLPASPAPPAPTCAIPSLPASSVAQFSILATSTAIATPVSTPAPTSMMSAPMRMSVRRLSKPLAQLMANQQGYQYQQYVQQYATAPATTASSGYQCQQAQAQAQAQYYYPNQYNGCNTCYKQY